MKELIYGSSLIWGDEGDGEAEGTYGMHRLVRRFILSDMVLGSEVWNHVLSLAVPAIQEGVKTELEKEGNSFFHLPDVFRDNHRELSSHSLALVHHYMIQAQDSETWNVSKVKNINWYTGKVMRFLGKSGEVVEVWEHLLAILHRQQTQTEEEIALSV